MAAVGKFGSTLRSYRTAANLTQEELAARAGLSVHAIGMLERGVRRLPRPGTVELLARALRLDRAERTALVAAARDEAPPAAAPAPAATADEFGLPPSPTVHFVGREAELRKLGEMLARGGSAAVTGLGGIGKTQLAARYAHEYRDRYPDGVFWIRAEQEGGLLGDLAGLAWRLGLPERAAPERERRIAAVLSRLCEHPRWLLVLDNLEPATVEARNKWLPSGLPGHVLITSRAPMPPPQLRLESFPAPVASRYLLERTAQADAPAAAAVAEALGRLPLALAQAAAYLDQTGRDLGSYATLLRSHLVELMAEGRPDDYPRSVVGTLDLSLRRLDDERPAAVALLRLASFLAGDDIPIRVLQAGAGEVPGPLRAALDDDMELDRTVVALRRYSLAERQGDGLRVHRVVQAIVRGSLPPDEYAAWLATAVRLLAPHFRDDVEEFPQLWPLCARLLPHARTVEELTATCPVEPAALTALLTGVTVYLWSQGDYESADPTALRAAQVGTEALGPRHPLTLQAVQIVGVLRWYQGELAQARELLEGLVTMMDEDPECDERALGTLLHNLATLVQVQGEHAAARPLYQRALDIRRRVLGPDHPHTIYTLNNLGTLLGNQGDFPAARRLLEQALRLRERILGPEHPETAHSLAGLGLLLLEHDRSEEAEPLLARAVAIREKVLGDDHDRTARSRYHLALVLSRTGDRRAARRLMRRAADDLARRLGADHRWTVQAEQAMADLAQEPDA